MRILYAAPYRTVLVLIDRDAAGCLYVCPWDQVGRGFPSSLGGKTTLHTISIPHQPLGATAFAVPFLPP